LNRLTDLAQIFHIGQVINIGPFPKTNFDIETPVFGRAPQMSIKTPFFLCISVTKSVISQMAYAKNFFVLLCIA
jgi:hypothetical protein